MAEFEKYIPKIQSLGLNEIKPREKAHMCEVYGPWVNKASTPAQIVYARGYIDSPAKEKFETLAARVFALAGKMALTLTDNKLGGAPQQNNLFYLEVGFPFIEDASVMMPKIQTMVNGAHDLLTDPFDHTTFRSDRGLVDPRIVPTAQPLRQSGLDEVPQLGYVAKSMSLVGLRGYTLKEIEGIHILINLREDPRLGFSPEVQEILTIYGERMIDRRPRPAVFSMLSGLDSKETSHMVRMLLDLTYLDKACPLLDFVIIARTVERRLIRRIGAR